MRKTSKVWPILAMKKPLVDKDKVVALHEVPNNTWVQPQISGCGPIKFHHIDGMYSYCKDADGNVVHLKAWTPVKILDGFPL